MNMVELYKQVPQDRHREVVVSGDRLFLAGFDRPGWISAIWLSY